MRKLIGGVVLAAALVPGALAAQHTDAKHEFGVDAVFVYLKPSGRPSGWVAGSPADVRIGFLGTGRITFETGFQFGASGGGGSSSCDVSIGVAAQWAKDHRKGLYLQAGPAVELYNNGSSTFTFFHLDGHWDASPLRLIGRVPRLCGRGVSPQEHDGGHREHGQPPRARGIVGLPLIGGTRRKAGLQRLPPASFL